MVIPMGFDGCVGSGSLGAAAVFEGAAGLFAFFAGAFFAGVFFLAGFLAAGFVGIGTCMPGMFICAAAGAAVVARANAPIERARPNNIASTRAPILQ